MKDKSSRVQSDETRNLRRAHFSRTSCPRITLTAAVCAAPGAAVLVVLILVAVPGARFSFQSLLGTDLGPRFDIGRCPLCACNLCDDIGRKNAELVSDGTCVRLYDDGGLDPAALPGALFDVVLVFAVAAVEGLEGGSPGSPTGPVAPSCCLPPSPSASDMADDVTLMACCPLSGTVNPVGKDDRSPSSDRGGPLLMAQT